MNIFKAIVSPIKALWDKILGKVKDEKFRDAIKQVITEAVDLFEVAKPVVQMLALATPTTIDDEIVRIADRAAIDIKAVLALPKEEQGNYLRDTARAVIRENLVQKVVAGKSLDINGVQILSASQVQQLSDSLLNRAIEFAYGAVKKALDSK